MVSFNTFDGKAHTNRGVARGLRLDALHELHNAHLLNLFRWLYKFTHVKQWYLMIFESVKSCFVNVRDSPPKTKGKQRGYISID